MDLRKLAILAAVLAGLCLAAVTLFWFSSRDTSDAPLAKAKAENVSKLQFDRAGVSTVLEREGDSWRLTSPVRDIADPNPVGDVVNALLGLRIGSEVSSEPSSYAEYAVDDASATRVRLYTSESAAPVFDGFFGRKALGYDSLYLRLSSRKPVHLASGVAPYQLDRHPDEFRERGLTRVDRATLESVSLRFDSRTLEIAKSSTGFVVSGAEASPDKVETAVDRILGLRAGDFSDAPTKPSETGLDKPAIEISVRGSARTTRLLVGRSKPGPKGAPSPYRYTQVEGRPALLLVSGADLQSIADLILPPALPKRAPARR
ncbi:MAG: DUF4340 domain-containing protein [Elusimicrobia bacterium]|nr:DUF4340 domain-containing protein [Elusimicrobiota bacterium]